MRPVTDGDIYRFAALVGMEAEGDKAWVAPYWQCPRGRPHEVGVHMLCAWLLVVAVLMAAKVVRLALSR